MDKLSRRLFNFFSGESSPAIESLFRGSEQRPKRYPLGKNLHFIASLCVEGREILDRRDSPVIPFTSGDVDDLHSAHDLSWKAFVARNVTSDAFYVIREMPHHMLKVASYYEEKIRLSEERSKAIWAAFAIQDWKYQDYLDRENYNALLDFFPQRASAFYDDGETEIPVRQPGNVYPFLRGQMAAALKESFIECEGLIGRPEIFREVQLTSNGLRADIRHDTEVLEAIRAVSAGLEAIASPKPKVPTNLYVFPKPATLTAPTNN